MRGPRNQHTHPPEPRLSSHKMSFSTSNSNDVVVVVVERIFVAPHSNIDFPNDILCVLYIMIGYTATIHTTSEQRYKRFVCFVIGIGLAEMHNLPNRARRTADARRGTHCVRNKV